MGASTPKSAHHTLIETIDIIDKLILYIFLIETRRTHLRVPGPLHDQPRRLLCRCVYVFASLNDNSSDSRCPNQPANQCIDWS